jgi:hypothetical protein
MSEMTLDETLAKRAKRRALYERDVKDWTLDELVEVLTDRYSPDPIPPCRLCGAELSIQSMGSGPTVYNCDGREPDPDHPGHLRWKEGRTPADEHYVRSEYEDCKRGGDEDVLEAVRRLKATADDEAVAEVYLGAANKVLGDASVEADHALRSAEGLLESLCTDTPKADDD